MVINLHLQVNVPKLHMTPFTPNRTSLAYWKIKARSSVCPAVWRTVRTSGMFWKIVPDDRERSGAAARWRLTSAEGGGPWMAVLSRLKQCV